ncbi:hypothetical protein K1T71_013561 [Dendrolimus kikuchii]|uniref:Uncharacterized protein n=1 Tax=Dendrolimus kikuchii TaxID=765133 RepID=A0ACC1CGU5_9NEOP|nr:hypothetical protein K1T71_013561 [Dendrolimus kikuchii]
MRFRMDESESKPRLMCGVLIDYFDLNTWLVSRTPKCNEYNRDSDNYKEIPKASSHTANNRCD